MKYILILSFSFFALALFSQHVTFNTIEATAKYAGKVNLAEQTQNEDWKVNLVNLEMPVPGGGSYRAFLQEQREIQRERYPLRKASNDKIKSGGIEPPLIGQMFEGNEQGNGVPNDNSLAVSNDGILISTINSTIWMYDLNNAGELIYSASFNSFTNNQFGFPNKYDPKIIYDPIADRFTFVFLRGSTPGHTLIIFAFSEPGNPTGDWNIYTIYGNPLDNNRWTDYPALSQNEEDLFITGNLIIPNEPWQTGFDGSVIWQINKQDGYNGEDELNIQGWFDIYYDSTLVRNLNPVDGEQTLTKDNMFLLSNRNFALENDTLFLLEVTNTLSSGEAELTVQALKSDDAYFLAPSARQPNDHTFDTNDSRVLGAVLFENSIQFVQNCLDTASGVTAVYHGTIDNLYDDPQVTGNIVSFPMEDLDIGYPNISHIGVPGEDENTLISFVHSGPDHFAGTSCILYDALIDGYTDRIVLKEGVDYVDVISGVYERWGDYTGSQPVYNIPGTVWIAGSFGNELQRNATWLAEISTSGQLTGIENNPHSQNISAASFPNPATQFVSVELEVVESTVATVSLFNMQGQLIDHLYSDRIKSGKNLLTFDVSRLSVGQYLITVTTDQGVKLTEKVIKK